MQFRTSRPQRGPLDRLLALCAAVLIIVAGKTGPTVASGSTRTARECPSPPPASSCADSASCRRRIPRSQDQIWLLSTRSLCCSSLQDEAAPALKVHRFDLSEGWRSSSLSEFLAAGEAEPTVLFVHGNRVESLEAVEEGWTCYSALIRAADQPPPMRFVVWSWPSDQIRGPIRDVRCKAERTNWEGVYLAWFLSRLDSQALVSLIGYSYGARVITGALHMLGGGSLAGQRLAGPGVLLNDRLDSDENSTVEKGARPPRADAKRRKESTRLPYRVVLMAAAMHNYWLSPGALHGKAPEQMGRLLLLYNSCDPVLRRYRVVEKEARPQALGYTGLCNLAAFQSGNRDVEQWNVRCVVGKSHSVDLYLRSPQLMERVGRDALWRPAEDFEPIPKHARRASPDHSGTADRRSPLTLPDRRS